MFGPGVKVLQAPVPLPREDEEEGLRQLRVKLGPYADEQRLLHHLRSARGKTHWAVNAFLREVMSQPHAMSSPATLALPMPPSSATSEPGTPATQAEAPLQAPLAAGLVDSSTPPPAAAAVAAAAVEGSKAAKFAAQEPSRVWSTTPAVDPVTQIHGSQGVSPNGTQQPEALPIQGSHMCGPEQPAAGGVATDAMSDGHGVASQAEPGPRQTANPPSIVITMGSSSSSSTTAAVPSLDHLPQSVLELILSHLQSHTSLAAAACTCRAMQRAATADTLWHQLFLQRWGTAVFPTEPSAPVYVPFAASSWAYAGAPAPGVAAAAAAAALGPMAASTARGNPPQGPGAAGMASIGGGATRDAVRGDTPTAGGRASGSAAPAGMAAGGGGGGRGSREAPAVSELQKLQPSGNPILEGPSMQRPTTSTTNAHAEQHGSVPQAQQPTNSMQASQERTTGTQCQQQQQQELQQGQHEGSRDGLSKQGPWQQRYRTQVSYASQLLCPRCGPEGRLVPLVYGFPSPQLLEGMRRRALILGGDHLIEDCHCWCCVRCNASFRTYPYEQPHLWIADHKAQSERAAAMARQHGLARGGSGQAVVAAGGAGGGAAATAGVAGTGGPGNAGGSVGQNGQGGVDGGQQNGQQQDQLLPWIHPGDQPYTYEL